MEALIAGSYRAAYTLALRLLKNPDDAAEATQKVEDLERQAGRGVSEATT